MKLLYVVIVGPRRPPAAGRFHAQQGRREGPRRSQQVVTARPVTGAHRPRNTMASDICPACGCHLDFASWSRDSASDEICPCCGIQFGYDDVTGDDADARSLAYERWRAEWIAAGSRWFSKSRKPPADWNAQQQLDRLRMLRERSN
jgi:hypothetical protein